ncbi:Multisite-specific tRNA:(cytosine-C(5))-methyltransferase trm4a [Tritrichomonas foetus]|uniref:Multisite-specific tRNA:(Cytosine-C(5))-methyltransferase trm4a n=1 Tax=Tritrichomonas foetus TaxID=1144522 RepID=A0A1J4KI72_9EUKA|nr:Multisite-specific tRNA:(cytosine-C(5))-methyltransferase trm4a [Tritrichomonas foetus]|eukprot:OHT09516.1 Multisite-specific tRNA:(cytosine-C(5))-methyltransferase trm4a [Tritrichomonas foetus]
MGRKKGRQNKNRNKNPKERQENTRVEPGYIPPDFIEYYKNQLVPNALTDEEFESFITTYKITLPHVFRLLTNSPDFPRVKSELEEHIRKLKELNYDAEIIDYLDPSFGLVCKLSVSRPQLRKNAELHPFRDWLHAHTEVGDITRQEFVSMLPPFFLDVQPDNSVVDMCAAPGSKTMQILETLKTGFLVANDIETNRCHTLVHQLNRIDTSKVLVINHPAQYIPEIGQFDRVLCDVPCSGDGTFRKNPDATKKWSTRNGCGLHSIQRSILIRGLQLLKIGGYCVYSTCSMNPIEDEAVISSVINELGGSVSILDCSSKFPGLKRTNGMKTWGVYSDKTKFEKIEDVPEELSKQIRDTMFPLNVVDGIENCMRFFPHQNDTGGFFVAVLCKNSEFSVRVQTTQHASKTWKEPPFIQLANVEGGNQIIEEIKNDYGMKQEFNPSHLFARAEKSVKTIFYLTDQIVDLVQKIPEEKLRPVACGTRLFSYKSLNDENAVKAFPCFEGIEILNHFATKRIVSIAPSDLKETLKAGNPGLQFSQMTEEAATKLKELPVGGLIVTCEGTNFVYGGMKRMTNLTLQVKKERIKQEIFKLVNFFPDLADDSDKNDSTDENSQNNSGNQSGNEE